MKVTIKAFANFREILGKEIEVEIPSDATLKDLLDLLAKSHIGLDEAVFEPTGELKDTAMIMLNRVNIDSQGGLDALLKEGDELAIFPPFAGG